MTPERKPPAKYSSMNILASKAFFWSDTHFWHTTAAKHRHFDSVEAMNARLIELAQEKLRADSTLFLLGDVSFAGSANTRAILNQIPGRKVLIRGNHDKGMNRSTLDCFDSVHDLLTVKVECAAKGIGMNDIQRIVLCHFPLLSWDMAHYGTWHLHGHSHGRAKYPKEGAKVLDVGVDGYPNRPVIGPWDFNALKAYMDSREVVSFDQYGTGEAWAD